jgi:hypothetical protein
MFSTLLFLLAFCRLPILHMFLPGQVLGWNIRSSVVPRNEYSISRMHSFLIDDPQSTIRNPLIRSAEKFQKVTLIPTRLALPKKTLCALPSLW